MAKSRTMYAVLVTRLFSKQCLGMALRRSTAEGRSLGCGTAE